MAGFHVNDKGEAGSCSASSGNCPFGGPEEHFTSAEAARKAYETKTEAKEEAVKKWTKKSAPKVSHGAYPYRSGHGGIPPSGHGGYGGHGGY